MVQLPIGATPQRIDAPPEIIVPEAPRPKPAAPLPSPPAPKPEQATTPTRRRTVPQAKPAPAGEAPASAPVVPVGPVGPPAEPPAAAPAPLPQLAPMLTAEQRRAFDTAIDNLLAQTQQDITRARTRNLSAEQKEMVARAEAFVKEARQIREQDPAAAKSMAERAALLSREAAGR